MRDSTNKGWATIQPEVELPYPHCDNRKNGHQMLVIPKASLQVHAVIASAMSRHTFAIVGPSKNRVENREIATGVGVRWKGQYLILTAGHVVDYCPEDTLRFFLPVRHVQFAPQEFGATAEVETRKLVELLDPKPPVFADHPIDLAAIVLPPQPDAADCFTVLDQEAVTPGEGAQVGVLGYPAACKVPLGQNYMATPEHFFGHLDRNGTACCHDPRQDFTVPYEVDHRANGYSGSGVWYFHSEPLWLPEPRLCGILATECPTDKVVSGFCIETVVKFLQDNEDLLLG